MTDMLNQEVVATVNVTIDGVELQVPKGTLAIRAAELIGVEIPRFCDHPLLEPVAACRACLIEVEGMPKPQPACAQVVSDGMTIHTQQSSAVARDAQEGVLEFLLLNHPLDCPVCDKGGECPLQNQAMSAGRSESRFEGEKRIFEKPIPISAQILLDRERCVSCARCTRFSEQIAGDPMIELLERGANQQVGIASDEPFNSYFSGNTIQICPVGALTSADYRFRSRPFDLVSTPTACEHCASGCSLRTDSRRGEVTRRLAWEDPQVNEDWNCDKGRFAFRYQAQDRITTPLVREDGTLRPASWPEAIDVAARGLQAAGSATGVLTGGRLSVEDAYGYAKFARGVLGTDHIDFRSRANSEEEAQFLRACVAGTPLTVSYAALESAPFVLLVAFEPEDESPIVYLRLRKAGTRVVSIATRGTKGLAKMGGSLLAVVPGREAQALRDLPADIRQALSQPGAVILVGERIAASVGGPTAVASLAAATGAALAWIPRRAGERGALDAGALSGLLPGGRPLTDARARSEVAAAWGVDADSLPSTPASDVLDAASRRSLKALLVAGVDPADMPAPFVTDAALERAAFIVSLDHHYSEITEFADVVLPVALVTEKSGTFIDWEGRPRPFAQVFKDSLAMSDASVLGMLARAMGATAGAWDGPGIRREITALGTWSGQSAEVPAVEPEVGPTDGFRLASWRELLDAGVMQEGEPHLAATARPVVAVVSSSALSALGSPASVTVTGPLGSVQLPVEAGEVLDNVIFVPMNAPGCSIYTDLGARIGAAVDVTAGGVA
ncbi:MAG: NADH-quinone oxidoreductase subunit G [Actinomycetota bacterium]|nr:NADH-quinone oxidoreductase subunit G [Actinomycetota bacterium]